MEPMPTAEIISITTRRNALRLSAAATVTGLLAPVIAIAAPIGPHADAGLLDMCRQFDVDSRAVRDYDARALAGDRTAPMDQNELDLLLEQWDDGLDEIISLSATTMAGIRAKATALGHALMQCAFVDTDMSVDEQGENYELLAMSLVRDLAAVLG